MNMHRVKLNRLSIGDKSVFYRYLSLKAHRLSAYTFENIYLWKKLFTIEWALIDDCLCVFFRDNIGCFLYLPPLGKNVGAQTIERVFGIMDRFSRNKEVSRIENIEEDQADFYGKLQLRCRAKYPEYICRRIEQAQLKGNRFKHKRADCNYFLKHYTYKYLPFSLKEKGACLRLYEQWMRIRAGASDDSVYQGLMRDSLSCLGIMLADYPKLDVTGRVVRIDGQIKAFTFGFPINDENFCVFFEITDLEIKGLAQFIFREFCREMSGYKYINIMDDSGLDNLKKVKLSYRPVEIIPAYIADRSL